MVVIKKLGLVKNRGISGPIKGLMEFFKIEQEFTEFSKFRSLKNHWSMNWTQFEDPVSHMCLTGAVVASSSLTLVRGGWEAGSSPFTVMTNIF